MSYVEILDEAMALNEQITEENIVRVFGYLDKDHTGKETLDVAWCNLIVWVWWVGAISCGDIVDKLEADNVNQDDVVQVCASFLKFIIVSVS